jgi:hypothetical protein
LARLVISVVTAYFTVIRQIDDVKIILPSADAQLIIDTKVSPGEYMLVPVSRRR